MGNTQSHVVASLSLCTLYLVYANIYCSYCLLRTKELHSNRLPSFAYLLIRYLARCWRGTAGCGNSCTSSSTGKTGLELEYTVHGCRLDTNLLRRFCAVAGYGWDYPDSEYRDIPLCFPEALCSKLLLMLLTDGNFKLSPAGLVRVRQSVRTLQPIDELKKGPFRLRASVLVYRAVDAGVEVDIGLSAMSRSSCLVWESVLTLLSTNKNHKDTTFLPMSGTEEHKDGLDLKQVDFNVPRFPMMPYSWSSGFCLPRLLCALCGFKPLITPRLWMLSVCLAEIEKHKGVKVVTAPANVTAQFTEEPQRVKGQVNIRFWDATENGSQVSQKVYFNMNKHGSSRFLVEGQIFTSVPK